MPIIKKSPFNASSTWTKPQVADTTALSSGVAWDASAIQHAAVDISGGNFTVANPSAQTNKCMYAVYVTYSTSHSLAWGSNFKGVTGVAGSNAAGKHDIYFFRSNGTNMELVGYKLDVGA